MPAEAEELPPNDQIYKIWQLLVYQEEGRNDHRGSCAWQHIYKKALLILFLWHLYRSGASVLGYREEFFI